jgi:hypothetical protein
LGIIFFPIFIAMMMIETDGFSRFSYLIIFSINLLLIIISGSIALGLREKEDEELRRVLDGLLITLIILTIILWIFILYTRAIILIGAVFIKRKILGKPSTMHSNLRNQIRHLNTTWDVV